MSFFGETKNFGWVFTISELIVLIVTIASFVVGITKDGFKTGEVCILVSSVLATLFTLAFAIDVLKGKYGDYMKKFGLKDATVPFDVLCGYLLIGGAAAVITGAGMLIGLMFGDNLAEVDLVGGAVGNIVVGILFIIIAAIMMDEKKTIADKLIFVILAILFIIALLVTIFAVFGAIVMFGKEDVEPLTAVFTLIIAIFGVLESIFVLAFLSSPSTKKGLGV